MVTTPEDVLVPPRRDAALWRYIDLAKFISMLKDEAIHFARIDMLDDKWEGHWPSKTLKDARIAFDDPDGETEPLLKIDLHRQIFSASCWHLSEDESFAMWKLYADRGLAIKSTYGQLTDAFTRERPTYGGQVTYGGPEHLSLRLDSMIPRFMWKRASFAYEQEVRYLLPLWNGGDDIAPGTVADKVTPVHVDLDQVLNTIYVSPISPQWVVSGVEEIVRRFNLSVPVIQSDLDAGPMS